MKDALAVPAADGHDEAVVAHGDGRAPAVLGLVLVYARRFGLSGDVRSDEPADGDGRTLSALRDRLKLETKWSAATVQAVERSGDRASAIAVSTA